MCDSEVRKIPFSFFPHRKRISFAPLPGEFMSGVTRRVKSRVDQTLSGSGMFTLSSQQNALRLGITFIVL